MPEQWETDLWPASRGKFIDKYSLPFVVTFNQGSVCHVDTTGTMHPFLLTGASRGADSGSA